MKRRFTEAVNGKRCKADKRKATHSTLAGTPFVGANGVLFEVHDYEYDRDGRRWEITVAGPFPSEQEASDVLARLKQQTI